MQKTNGLVKRMLALGLAVTTIATSFSTGYAPLTAKAATVDQEVQQADRTDSGAEATQEESKISFAEDKVLQKAVDGAGFTIDPATGKVVTAAIRYHDALLKMGEDFTAKATCTNKKEDTDRTTYTYDVTIEGQGAYSGAYTRSGVTQIKKKEVAATSKAATTSEKKTNGNKKAAGALKTVAKKKGAITSTGNKWEITWGDLPESEGQPVFILYSGSSVEIDKSDFASVKYDGITLNTKDYKIDVKDNDTDGSNKVVKFSLTDNYKIEHSISNPGLGLAHYKIIKSAATSCPVYISTDNGSTKHEISFETGSKYGYPKDNYKPEYTGSVIKPDVYVYQTGSNILEEYTSDYVSTDAMYTNVTSNGSYAVIKVKFGAKRANEELIIRFQIAPCTIQTSDVTIDDCVYNGQAQPSANKVHINTNGQNLTSSDFDITSTAIDSGTRTATIKGKGNYQGSVTKNFTINPKAVVDGTDVDVQVDNAVYDGTQKKPNVTITDKLQGITLVQGTDYSLSYGANDTQGDTAGTVTITFNRNFSGTINKTFKIGKGDIRSANVLLDRKAITSAAYDPRYRTASERLSLEGVPSDSYDVEVSGTNGATWPNAGTYTATFKGKGSYSGTLTKNITITKVNLNDSDVIVEEKSITSNSNGYTPSLKLTHRGAELSSTDDYTLTISGDPSSQAGASIIATAKNTSTNYTGSKTVPMKSTGADLSTARYEYSGTTPLDNQLYICAFDPFTGENLTQSSTAGMPYYGLDANGQVIAPHYEVFLHKSGTDWERKTGFKVEVTQTPTNSKVGRYYFKLTGTGGGLYGTFTGTSANFDIKANALSATKFATASGDAADKEFTYYMTKVTDTSSLEDLRNNLEIYYKNTATGTTKVSYHGTDNCTWDKPVYLTNGSLLENEKDYEITRISANKATITGKGAFSGTASIDLGLPDLSSKDFELTIVDALPLVYDTTDQFPGVQLRRKSTNQVILLDPTKYDVVYLTSAGVEARNKQKNPADTDFASVGTYYVRVEAKSGNTEYQGKTANVSYQISATGGSQLEIRTIGDQTYTTSVKAPADLIKDKVFDAGTNKKLTFDTDYEIDTTNTSTDYNVPGLKTITIKGKGKYKYNTASKTYRVVGDLSNVLDTDLYTIGGFNGLAPGNTNNLFYDGSGWKDENGKNFNPNLIKISVKDGGELVKDEDYTISSGNFKAEGPVSLTIRAKSEDYTGEKIFNFNIKATRNGLKWTHSGTNTIELPYIGTAYTVGEGMLTVGSDAAEWRNSAQDTVTITGTASEIQSVGTYTVTIASNTSGGGTTTLTVKVLYDLTEAKVYYGADKKLLNGESFTYTGQSYVDMSSVKVEVRDKELAATDYAISRSYDPSVSTAGASNFSAAGTIVVKLTAKPDRSSFFGVTPPVISYSIKPINLSLDDHIHITMKNGFQPVYDGRPHLAQSGTDFTVTYTPDGAGSQTLEVGKDYSVTIVGEDSNCINAGTYTLYVIGQGNYTGQNQKTTYKITPHDFSRDNTSDFEIEDMLFAGKGNKLTPSTLKFKLNGNQITLTRGVDYKINSSGDNDDTNVKGTITIGGMHNYTGTKGPLEFNIVKIDLANANVYVKNAEYGDIKGETDLDNGKYVQVYIPFEGNEQAVKLTKGVDYSLEFRLSGQPTQTYPDKVGTYQIVLHALSGSKMVKTGTTYDNKKEIIISPKNIASAGTFTVGKTAWSAAGAKPVVRLDGKVIYENGAIKDEYKNQYKITVTNNTKACAATLDEMYFDKSYTNESQLPTVTIEGIGNYGGEVVKHFQIGDQLKKSDVVVTNGTFKYDGKPHTPTYTVKGLTAGQYTDNLNTIEDTTNAGIKEFSVTATAGPKFGSVVAEYTIIPDRDSVWGYKLDLPKDPTDGLYYVKYAGEAIQPKVIDVYVLDSKGKKTEISEDEIKSIEYTNNTGVGTGNVKVTLTNYQGNLDATAANKNPTPFKILSVNILEEDYSISLKGGSNRFAYTGKEVTPEVVVTRNSTGKDLVKNTDYVVEYKNNTNAGPATATVKAINNYTGTKVLNFGVYADFRDEKQTQITIPKQLPPEGELTELKGAKVVSGGNDLTKDKEYSLTIYSTDGYQKSGVAVFTPKTEYYIGSKTVTFAIGNDESMYNILGVANAYTYNHIAQKPVPIVTDKTGNMIAVNPANITYNSTSDGTSCINAGYVTMTIPVTNAGSTIKVTRKYNILPKNINAVSISKITSKKYSGESFTPVLKIVDGTYLLVGTNGNGTNNKSDYAYSYSDNIYPGRARVHVVGTNNYTGVSDIYFNITVNDVSAPKVTPKSTTSLKLTWTKVSGISGYRILYTPQNGRQQQVKVGKSTKSKTLTGLEKGTTYTIGIQTYVKTSNGRTGYGSVSVVQTATKPATPKAKVKRVGTRKYKISWSKVSGADGYMVYRKTGSGKWSRIKTISSASTVSYTNTGLKKGTVYTYRVLAYHKVGTKRIYSNFSSAKRIRAK